ncbi:Protein of unknown function [Devosia enhydra]|uniref:DUF2852 domain-containing protein n=1 Tax=Devosia enhydra TaxID=665118 RepID=A0A1K2HYE2_9HYPH|nr:DUF2852 domain-containing protein [Devosia enhydra]SFZ84976.1 Protein of unknown function [Devosia enhydra]
MSTAIIKPQWSPLTIALMVIGFIVWWPAGLAVLSYILWGEYMGGSAEKAQRFVDKQKAFFGKHANRAGSATTSHGAWTGSHSGNAAFDEYRAEQLRKLEEERRRLDEEIAAFHEYNASLNKQKEREEFERFMAERRGSRQGFDAKPEDRRY